MRYGDWKRAETVALIDKHGGLQGARSFVANCPAPIGEPPKYGELTEGQIEALINKFGIEVVEAILQDDAEVSVGKIIIPSFRAVNGSRIRPRGFKDEILKANLDFRFDQLETIDFEPRLARSKEYVWPKLAISATELEERYNAILKQVGAMEQCRNVLKGPHYPIVIGKSEIADIGTFLDTTVLPGVGRSYLNQFPKRTFNNYRKGELANEVTVVEGSRCDALLKAIAESDVVAAYFVCPLQGWSITADRNQMATLPQEFILAEAIAGSAGIVMFPDVLARDFNVPGQDLAGNQWQSAGRSLYFRARDESLEFDYRYLDAHDRYSGGLLVLG